MAQVGVYADFWGSLGGGSRFVGVLAAALARRYEVEVVHHCHEFEPEAFGEAIEVDLHGLQFRHVPMPRRGTLPRNPLRRLQAERQLGAEISSPYEFFLASRDTPPFFSHAVRSALLVHFPIVGPDAMQGPGSTSGLRPDALVRKAYGRIEWARRMRSYEVIFCNSLFTQHWMRQRWRVEAEVVYPPLRKGLRPTAKENVIVSLGRFSPSGTKNQLELIETFKRLCDDGVRNWRYCLIGAVKDTDESRTYLASLKAAAGKYPIDFRENLSGKQLAEMLGKAAILWHSKGYGVDGNLQPELLEHFGMVTTEAMAAGCVPVVYAAGGQLEIVEPRRNGQLWSSVDELREATRSLIEDVGLRSALAEAAVDRAEQFSEEACLETFFRHVHNLLPVSTSEKRRGHVAARNA